MFIYPLRTREYHTYVNIAYGVGPGIHYITTLVPLGTQKTPNEESGVYQLTNKKCKTKKAYCLHIKYRILFVEKKLGE